MRKELNIRGLKRIGATGILTMVTLVSSAVPSFAETNIVNSSLTEIEGTVAGEIDIRKYTGNTITNYNKDKEEKTTIVNEDYKGIFNIVTEEINIEDIVDNKVSSINRRSMRK